METEARQLQWPGKATEWVVTAAAATHEIHDIHTAKHSNGVVQLSTEIAGLMGLSEEQIWLIRLGSKVHDIGKIGVPLSILQKPGRLTTEEYEIVMTHCEIGYGILRMVPIPWPVAEIVRQHHERLDASGYPLGLRGSEILIEAQVLAVADVADSMLSRRPYRRPFVLDHMLEHIEGQRGTTLNAEAVNACAYLFRETGYKHH